MAQPASTGLPFEQARLALNQAKQLVNTLDKTMPEVVKMGDQLRQAELTLVAANKLYTQTMETAVKFKTPSRTKECVNPVTGGWLVDCALKRFIWGDPLTFPVEADV